MSSNILRLWTAGIMQGHKLDLKSTDVPKLLPAVDDTMFQLGDGTNSWDVKVLGSAAANYFTWDASANDLKFEDSVSLMFGTGATAGVGTAGDVEIRWDGTDLDVLGAANNLIIKWGNGTNSFDQWWYGSAAANYISWDASANDLKFEDSVSLMFGTGAGAGPGNAGDVEIRWDATDLDVLVAVDDTVIKFGNGTLSADLWWYGNTASDYVLIDASANEMSLQGAMTLDVPAGQLQIANAAVDSTAAELNRGTDVSSRLVAAGAALSVTVAAHADREIMLDTLAGSTCTLPAATGTGARFTFRVSVLATSNSHIIKVADASDIIQGLIFTASDDATNVPKVFQSGDSDDTITLNRTTTGSVERGEWIEVIDAATDLWLCRGMTASTGTEATPFSATV